MNTNVSRKRLALSDIFKVNKKLQPMNTDFMEVIFKGHLISG